MGNEILPRHTKLLTAHSLAELVYSKPFTPRNNLIFTDSGEPRDTKWTGRTSLDGEMRPIRVSSTLNKERFKAEELVTIVTIGDYDLGYRANLSIIESLYEMVVLLNDLSFSLSKRELFSPERYYVGKCDQLVARLLLKNSREKLVSPTTIEDIDLDDRSRHGSKGFLKKVSESGSYDFIHWDNKESLDTTIGFLAGLYQRVAEAVNNPDVAFAKPEGVVEGGG